MVHMEDTIRSVSISFACFWLPDRFPSVRVDGVAAAGDPIPDNHNINSTNNVHLIVAFDALYGLGLIALVIVLVTAWLNHRIRRFSTWYMFLASWFIDSTAKLLLIGQQTTRHVPSYGFCLFQAALLNATPVL